MSNYLDARDTMTADDFAGLADDNHLDEPAHWPPGALLVVVGGLGIPSIVRVEQDGSWMCVRGIFKGRPIRTNKPVRHVCRDGDIFEDLGLVVRGSELVPMEAL